VAEHGQAAVNSGALADDERIDWLRLIRSEHVGPRGIMAQTPPDFDGAGPAVP
jgi:hypothetical protein